MLGARVPGCACRLMRRAAEPASFRRMPTLPAAWNEALLQHFTCRKLEIAYAIHKPFPFFEGLRDKAFITERMYTESLEACRNLVPVSRVVYNVLTRLEQTFSLQLLEALFSQINLREYPRLAAVLRSFRGACASHGEWSRPTVVLLEGPPDPAEGSRLQTLLPLPAPPPPPPSCLPTAHRGSEPGGSSASTSESLPGPTVGGRSTPGEKQTPSNPCVCPTRASWAILIHVVLAMPLLSAHCPFPGGS
uniref:HSR domain-containing protein n=1 Tax=Oryctolagus cuniculus TaxID=9986 RepID=G1SXY9_RABIT